MRFQPTIRLRLTLVYGGMFILAGAVLLTLNYALVQRGLQRQTGPIGVEIDPNLAGPLPGETIDFVRPAPTPGQFVVSDGRPLDEVLGQFESKLRDEALHELVARIRALARRAATAQPPVIQRGGLSLDPARRVASRDGRFLRLTNKELAVLEVLLGADGAVVSAEELLERAWDEHADPFTNAVRVMMVKLRRKLGNPPVIETVPGAGYRIP